MVENFIGGVTVQGLDTARNRSSFAGVKPAAATVFIRVLRPLHKPLPLMVGMQIVNNGHGGV